MSTATRMGRAFLSLGLVAMLAACSAAPGKPAPSIAPSAAAPSAAAAETEPPFVEPTGPDWWLAVGRPGDDRVHIILASTMEEMLSFPLGAPDPTWANVVTAEPRQTTTQVEDLPADHGFQPKGLGQSIAGAWRLPTIGLEPVPAGVSADGSTIVLVELDRPQDATVSRFAIVDRSSQAKPRIVELPGAFEFDALSPDGSLLYVVEHLPSPPAGHYQVRTIETATGTMRPEVIADKLDSSEAMAGWPVAQSRRGDGFVFTLYRGTEHPFIHALNSVDAWAVCLDLPASGMDDADAALDWGMAPSLDGQDLLAINATLGLAVQVDPDEFAIRQSVEFEPSAARGIVLAKFGHQATGPVGRRVVAAPDGTSIYAAGRGGIVRIDPRDLGVTGRFVEGQAVDAMAVTPDGSTVFALMSAGGGILKLDAGSGEVLGRVPSDGFDRLVAIVPY